MWEIISNTAAWFMGSTQERPVLFGPSFILNKKGKRLQWRNLSGELTDLPCAEETLHLWADDALAKNAKDINALYVKAYLVYRSKNYFHALHYVNQALNINRLEKWCLVLKGDILFCLKDFDEAIHCYHKVLEKDPDNLFARQGKGVWFYQADEFKMSAKYLQEVNLKISEGEVSWHETQLLYHQQADLFFMLGEYARAKDSLEKTLLMDSEDAYARKRLEDIALAMLTLSVPHWVNKYHFLQGGSSDYEALRCLDEALTLEPFNINVLTLKMNFLVRQKKIKAALECIEEILKVNPENVNAWNEKAILYKNANEWENALACAEKILELNPNFVPAFRLKVDILWARNRSIEVFRFIEKTLKLASLEIAELKLTAMDCLIDKREIELLVCAEALLERDEKNADALFFKSMSLALLKLGKEALTCIDIFLEHNPLNKMGVELKITILEMLEQYEEAFFWYEVLLSLDQRQPDIWKRRGKLLYMLSRYSEARDDIKSALQLFPEDGEIQYVYGNILFCEGEYKNALRYYEAVLKKDPGHVLALQGRGIYYFQRGEIEKYKRVLAEVERGVARTYLASFKVQIFNQRGELFLALKEYARAQEAFEQSLRVECDNSYAKRRLSEVKEKKELDKEEILVASHLPFFQQRESHTCSDDLLINSGYVMPSAKR